MQGTALVNATAQLQVVHLLFGPMLVHAGFTNFRASCAVYERRTSPSGYALIVRSNVTVFGFSVNFHCGRYQNGTYGHNLPTSPPSRNLNSAAGADPRAGWCASDCCRYEF